MSDKSIDPRQRDKRELEGGDEARRRGPKEDPEALKKERESHGNVVGGSRLAGTDSSRRGEDQSASEKLDDSPAPAGASGPPGSQGKKPQRRE